MADNNDPMAQVVDNSIRRSHLIAGNMGERAGWSIGMVLSIAKRGLQMSGGCMGALNRRDFLLLALVGGASLSVLSGCTGGSDQSGFTSTRDAAISYQDKVFDTSFVHAVEIEIAPKDWEDLKAHALDKKKFPAKVIIDGEAFDGVSVNAKGSSSLRTLYYRNKERFSLKVKFNHADASQTYHGLKSFDLANCLTDASMLKDYLAYGMFRRSGVPAALVSHAWVTVNGESYGLFAVAEDIGEGFLNRNGLAGSRLYKPEAGDLTDINDRFGKAIKEAIESGAELPANDMSMLDGLSCYAAGADLRYTGDDPAGYSDIFNNTVTDAGDDDKARVVAALKALSVGSIDQAINADEVIAYFAGHNFASNYDSYTGKMLHNYYLCEKDGLLSMIPWDYDYYDSLATNNSVTAIRHFADHHEDVDIDKPLIVPEDSRPMWTWIQSDEGYRRRYHQAVEAFLSACVDSGWAEKEVDRVSKMIRDHVQADPNAMYTVEEFDQAVKDLQEYLRARTENIRAQLAALEKTGGQRGY